MLRRCRVLLWGLVLGLGVVVSAHAEAVEAWLRQLQEAIQSQTYTGTMVVSVGEQMATAHVSHAVQQGQSLNRIEVLTGEPRTTFRRGQEVITLWPQQRLWVREQREDLAMFPGLSASATSALDEHYDLMPMADDRVAGRHAQVVALVPRDAARWGYRIWRDAASGVMLKLQTLSPGMDRVLEQTAFINLQWPLSNLTIDWAAAQRIPAGYTAQQLATRRVEPSAWGLQLSAPVPGFGLLRAQLPGHHPRPDAGHPLQWVFSDGLASVSVFFQPLEDAQPQAERAIRMGATNTVVRQEAGFRVTVVGEAPLDTLRAFAQALAVSPEAWR